MRSELRPALRRSTACSRQFVQVEGLEQVIVGAGLQSLDPVRDGVTGGQHQHRQFEPALAPAHQQAHAVCVGQAEVEHAGVELRSSHRGVGELRVFHVVHREAVQAQARRDAARHQRVVFDQQNMQTETSSRKGRDR
jgi:hypothetical protein